MVIKGEMPLDSLVFEEFSGEGGGDRRVLGGSVCGGGCIVCVFDRVK